MVAAPVVAPARRPVAVLRTAQVAAGLAVIALITVVTIDLTSSHSTGNTTSAHELRESAASAPNTAQDSAGKSAAATPAGSSALAIPPSTPPPGIVPPTGGGVGGQGVPCGASIQPLTPSSGAAAPLTPCPSPSPVASREGSASTLSPAPRAPATGATANAEGPTTNTFSSGEATPKTALGGATTAVASADDNAWEPPTEFALGGIAALAIAVSAFLMLRRRAP